MTHTLAHLEIFNPYGWVAGPSAAKATQDMPTDELFQRWINGGAFGIIAFTIGYTIVFLVPKLLREWRAARKERNETAITINKEQTKQLAEQREELLAWLERHTEEARADFNARDVMIKEAIDRNTAVVATLTERLSHVELSLKR